MDRIGDLLLMASLRLAIGIILVPFGSPACLGATIYGVEVDTRAVPKGDISTKERQVDLLEYWGYFAQAAKAAKDLHRNPAGRMKVIEEHRSLYEMTRKRFRLPRSLDQFVIRDLEDGSEFNINPDHVGLDTTLIAALKPHRCDVAIIYCPRPPVIGNSWGAPTMIKRCISTDGVSLSCSEPLKIDSQCNPYKGLSSFQMGNDRILQESLNQGNASEERFYRLTEKGVVVVNLVVDGNIEPFDVISGNTLGTGSSSIQFDPETKSAHLTFNLSPFIADHDAEGRPRRTHHRIDKDFEWNGRDFVLISSQDYVAPPE